MPSDAGAQPPGSPSQGDRRADYFTRTAHGDALQDRSHLPGASSPLHAENILREAYRAAIASANGTKQARPTFSTSISWPSACC
jgi:hypothetical protein